MSVVTEPVQGRHTGIAPERPMKFVFFPLGWVLAHVGRTVEIAKVLRERGHEVVFAGEDPDHPRSRLNHVVKAGFPVVHVKEPHWPFAWDRFHNYGRLVSIYDFFSSQRWAPLDVILDDIIRVCHEQKPDMIVGDSSMGVSTAGHILEIPAAGVLNAYNSYFYRPWSFYRMLISAWDKVYLQRIRGRVYKKHGVKQVNAIELLKSILLLSPDLPEFHKPHGTFPNWTPVGPILSEPPAGLPDWYDEILDGKPNVYITMGSTGLLEPLLRRSYEALGKTDYRFLVTTGGQVSQEAIDLAPSNFRFATYAPGSKILEQCKAMVFHGGNGSMYQALSQGVPMIALPSHLEQEVCVRTLLREGFGFKRCSRRTSGEELVKAIDLVISDPSYRAKAQAHRDSVRNARAAEKSADLLIEKAREGVPAGGRLSMSENILFFPWRKSPVNS